MNITDSLTCRSPFPISIVFRFSFFFQAEDGIRDDLVTGVQTCALPIWEAADGNPSKFSRPQNTIRAYNSGTFPRPAEGTKEDVMQNQRYRGSRGRAVAALEIGRASCRERV